MESKQKAGETQGIFPSSSCSAVYILNLPCLQRDSYSACSSPVSMGLFFQK